MGNMRISWENQRFQHSNDVTGDVAHLSKLHFVCIAALEMAGDKKQFGKQVTALPIVMNSLARQIRLSFEG